MIKGWRNDPRWVEYYARKKEAALKEEVERMKAVARMDASFAALNRSMRALNTKPLDVDTY